MDYLCEFEDSAADIVVEASGDPNGAAIERPRRIAAA